MEFYVHESSHVDLGATIGSDTKIWHFCHIMENTTIGKNCTLGQNVFVQRNKKTSTRSTKMVLFKKRFKEIALIVIFVKMIN